MIMLTLSHTLYGLCEIFLIKIYRKPFDIITSVVNDADWYMKLLILFWKCPLESLISCVVLIKLEILSGPWFEFGYLIEIEWEASRECIEIFLRIIRKIYPIINKPQVQKFKVYNIECYFSKTISSMVSWKKWTEYK